MNCLSSPFHLAFISSRLVDAVAIGDTSNAAVVNVVFVVTDVVEIGGVGNAG